MAGIALSIFRVCCGGLHAAEHFAPSEYKGGLKAARIAFGIATLQPDVLTDLANRKLDDTIVDFTTLENVSARQLLGDTKAVLVVSGVSMSDVQQGFVGDCWLLSACILLASRGDLLRPLFLKADLDKGEFKVRFFKNGVPVEVELDDSLPCFPSKENQSAWDRIASAHSTQVGELWLTILEKAYAQLHGGYANLHGGSLSDALEDLTGGHASELSVRSIDPCVRTVRVWRFIEEARREKWPIGCTKWSAKFARSSREVMDGDTGLAFNHSYAIVDSREIRVGGKILHMVKIRNPWGYGEWSGAYSDKDKDVWSDELLQALEHKIDDDGVFWMRLEDFCDHFTHVQTVRLLSDMYGSKWNRAQCAGKWTAEGAMTSTFTARVAVPKGATEPLRVVIALSRHDSRGKVDNETPVQPNEVAIALRVRLGGETVMDTGFVVRRSVSLDFALDAKDVSTDTIEVAVDASALLVDSELPFALYAYSEQDKVELVVSEAAAPPYLTATSPVSVGFTELNVQTTYGRTAELAALEKAMQSAQSVAVKATTRGLGLSHVLQVAVTRVLGAQPTYRSFSVNAREFDPKRWWLPLVVGAGLLVSRGTGLSRAQEAKVAVSALRLLSLTGVENNESVATLTNKALDVALSAIGAEVGDASAEPSERLFHLLNAIGAKCDKVGKLIVLIDGAETLDVDAVRALVHVANGDAANDNLCVVLAFAGSDSTAGATDAGSLIGVPALDVDAGVQVLRDVLSSAVARGLTAEVKLDSGSRSLLRTYLHQHDGNLMKALSRFTSVMQSGLIQLIDQPQGSQEAVAVAMAKLNISGALGHLRHHAEFAEVNKLLESALQSLSDANVSSSSTVSMHPLQGINARDSRRASDTNMSEKEKKKAAKALKKSGLK